MTKLSQRTRRKIKGSENVDYTESLRLYKSTEFKKDNSTKLFRVLMDISIDLVNREDTIITIAFGTVFFCHESKAKNRQRQ